MKTGVAGKVAQIFINSKLTPLLMIAFLALGWYATTLTPKEEEPQIDVPMVDIFVGYPGADPEVVEKRVSIPLEKVLSNIDGVEFVYSASMPERALVSAQFYVGENVENSLVKLYYELLKFADTMPTEASQPLIKYRSIDDVPMYALTIWSNEVNEGTLRQIAEELELEIKKIPNVAHVQLKGGYSRAVNITLDVNAMSIYGIGAGQIAEAIQQANVALGAGTFIENDIEAEVQAGVFFSNAEDVAQLIVGVQNGLPVYLHQVANIEDGFERPKHYVSHGFGTQLDGNEMRAGDIFSAVTLSVAKRSGSDAMQIAEQIRNKIDILKNQVIPQNVYLTETRNYGETASEKVFSLLEHLFGAIIAVTIVVTLALGWRGGLVVFLSVPVTFALTLFLYYLFGYTLNRITLFALIFVTGIVVDDSIIIAENMHRHFKMRKLPFRQAAIASINEVGNPTILATFTVIASVLPMAFVSGLMGPYMSPMPIGASLAMIFSLIVALVITPWLAFLLLPGGEKQGENEKPFVLQNSQLYLFYRNIMNLLFDSFFKRWVFIGGVALLLLASMTMFYFRMVEVKMLPFDNKNEVQVVLDAPEGTTLERLNAIASEMGMALATHPQVESYQVYSGISAPINFNGLVRQYDLRRGSNIGEIQVNLSDKSKRSTQSHDIAKELRPLVQSIALRENIRIKVVEVPPGPPVLSTLVVEVYGPTEEDRIGLAKKILEFFEQAEGVVDADWMVEEEKTKWVYHLNRQKITQKGLSIQQVAGQMRMALNEEAVSEIYSPKALASQNIILQLPDSVKANPARMSTLPMISYAGAALFLGDLAEVKHTTIPKTIFRKNQQPVVYVVADVAGVIESPVYAILDISAKIEQLAKEQSIKINQLYNGQPFTEEELTVKWDGEWQITYDVFRDLGTAFAVVLIIIYMLIIGWFQDFKIPIIMMIAIPLSLVGIIVGHWMLGAFFTATSMIGMIALAGIMVRNSVLLIDFINLRLADGVDIREAVIEAGAVRTMPILLTAGTVVIGAIVILFDPIFQGLAISLMGGAIGSTVLTLLMVPLIYFMSESGKHPLNN